MAATVAAEFSNDDDNLMTATNRSATSPEFLEPAAVGVAQQQQRFLSIVSKVSRWIAASDRHVRCLFAEDRSTSTTATQLSPSVLSEAGELERTALAERLCKDAVDRAAAARLARSAAAGTQQANNHGRHSNCSYHQRPSNNSGRYGNQKFEKKRRSNEIFPTGYHGNRRQSKFHLDNRNTATSDASIGYHGNKNVAKHRSCRLSVKLLLELPSESKVKVQPMKKSRHSFSLSNFHL
ncbi:hypothetical protein BOX15_Mlig009413g2 [Macrostomum lignano]|uniref:Uncharacterized protein n=1 Tax=Macrostomum lignano TaxID=282301 RepID=A0A267ET05_9PLAT|nr:hypothetical protein BOX15_Mlig009413g2 [Macrostomum lignano]